MILTLEEPDASVHWVKEVKCEKGTRKANTRCGAVVIDDTNKAPTEWAVWESRVTCPQCNVFYPDKEI